ncbi:MAG TPA: hypothetical protein DIV86_05115 [Alphaproteobacteria bacterium]|nr:hypothetical protein [Alphaproteobacteria bacterium]
MSEEKLSHKDVELLTNKGDLDSKVKVIGKISGHYRGNQFSDKEKKLAEEIFRLLMKYAEVGVRKSISENLMNADSIPRDIILSLAKDIDDVSRPILEFSEFLTDDDLLDIIKSSGTEAHVAISKREGLSETISGTLIETNQGEVAESLLSNSTAQIRESDLSKIVENFASQEEVIEALITRGSIPSKVVFEVTNKVSNVIKSKLEKKYNTSFEKINNLFTESSQIAAFRFGNMKIFGNDLIELINMLDLNNQLEQALDPLHGKLTFILNDFEPIGQFVPVSAVALGNKTIFEICMSRMTGVRFNNIRKLISDLDSGLKALYDRAKLPESLFDAVRFAIWVINSMDDEANKLGGPRAREDLHEFIKKLIALSKGRKIKNLSAFISIIKKHLDRQQGEW